MVEGPRGATERWAQAGAGVLSPPVAQRIIERVGAGLSQPISVTDAGARVLASSDPQLVGTRSPLAAALLAGEAASDGGAGRPLAYADSLVGAIVLHGADPASPVLQVARTLAELIIHQLVVLDQLPHRRWARDKFLDDLLHERIAGSPEVIMHQAAILEVDLAPPRLVALVDLGGLRTPPAPAQASSLRAIDHGRRVEAARSELVERARALVATREGDLSACLGDRWLAILPVLAPDPEGAAGRLAAGLEALLGELAAAWQLETWAGVGRAYGGWAALPRSFRDARFALEVGPTLGGRERVLTMDALGLAGLVCRSDAEARGEQARRLLAPLAGERELLETLTTFLRVDLAPSRAAGELSVHRHTLSYRLDKIAALTGLDPRRFRDAAQLHAALLIQRAGPADQPAAASRGGRPSS